MTATAVNSAAVAAGNARKRNVFMKATVPRPDGKRRTSAVVCRFIRV